MKKIAIFVICLSAFISQAKASTMLCAWAEFNEMARSDREFTLKTGNTGVQTLKLAWDCEAEEKTFSLEGSKHHYNPPQRPANRYMSKTDYTLTLSPEGTKLDCKHEDNDYFASYYVTKTKRVTGKTDSLKAKIEGQDLIVTMTGEAEYYRFKSINGNDELTEKMISFELKLSLSPFKELRVEAKPEWLLASCR